MLIEINDFEYRTEQNSPKDLKEKLFLAYPVEKKDKGYGKIALGVGIGIGIAVLGKFAMDKYEEHIYDTILESEES